MPVDATKGGATPGGAGTVADGEEGADGTGSATGGAVALGGGDGGRVGHEYGGGDAGGASLTGASPGRDDGAR